MSVFFSFIRFDIVLDNSLMNAKEIILFEISTTQHGKQVKQETKKQNRLWFWLRVKKKYFVKARGWKNWNTQNDIVLSWCWFEGKRQVIYFHFLCVSKFYWEIVVSLLHFAFIKWWWSDCIEELTPKFHIHR